MSRLPEHSALFFVVALLAGCSSLSFIVPNPPAQETDAAKPDTSERDARQPQQADPSPESTPKQSSHASIDTSESEKDFSFADTVQQNRIEETAVEQRGEAAARKPAKKQAAAHIDDLPVPSRMARIALKRGVGNCVTYSLAEISLQCPSGTKAKLRGRISVEYLSGSTVQVAGSRGPKLHVSLPCTLLSGNAHNYFELGDSSYRGSLIIAAGKKSSSFDVINYVDVEDYLRGVVPLEIGKRGQELIEAVKAQAVAARTYTYKRFLERAGHTYDLLPDVSDQVYGGVGVEDRVSDLAVMQTANVVMVHGDSIVHAYYHSTCGGQTANIEDVWNKTYSPCLRSVSDLDSNGNAYCVSSRYFDWRESWTADRLSSIMLRYAKAAFPNEPAFKGPLRSVIVKDTHSCGRVKKVVVGTSSRNYTYGGDKVRWVFRRDEKGHPILRSSRFKVISASRKGIQIKGRGYGHGVGMCQVGAVGRAAAGQSYEDILKAYYTGIELKEVQ